VRIKARTVATITVFGVLATAILAGTALAQDASEGGDDPITLIVGYTQPPNTMNPLKGLLTQEYEAFSIMYPLLFNFDKDSLVATADEQSIAAELPTTDNGGISADGLTYTIKIRDGYTWTDGEPITAGDVAFTYNLILDDHFSNFTNYLPYVDSITAPDDTTLVWKTTKPSVAPFVPPWISILPEHIWGELGDKDAIKAFDNYPDPVVAGPFTLTDWQKGESMTFEKVPNSYAGEPTIDRVIYQFFQNTETMVQALKQGTIDFAEQIPADLFDSLASDPNITRNVGAGLSFSHFSFNQCFVQKYCHQPNSLADPQAAVKDIQVRTAVAMAINKDQLVERVLKGYGSPGTTPVGPTQAFWHWDPDGDAIGWDIDGANQVLDDAGYQDTDGDGVRNMPGGGENLEWKFVLPNDNQDRVKAAELISGWLKQIGISADPEVLTVAKMTDVWYANDYDVQMWGWGPDPDPDFILSTYTTNQCGVWSDTCWSNTEYDKLYKQQQSARSPDQRQQIIQQMQQIWYDDVFQIVLWNDSDLQAYRSDRWEGFVPQPAPDENGNGGSILYQYGLHSYLNIQPITGGGTSTSSGGGISAGVWIAILAVAAIVIAAVVLMRRRRDDEDLA
jgi:peptide/nickel transport system substrate-binding protein